MTCPKIKCWEQHQGFTTRATNRDIALAAAHLRLRIAALPTIPSFDQLEKVRMATYYVTSLIGRQWREMVRKPFDFRTEQEIGTSLLARLGLAQQIKRRF